MRLSHLSKLQLSVRVLIPVFVLSVASSADASNDWLSSSWAFRTPFVANPDSIESPDPLEGFPLFLRLDGATLPSVFDHAKPDGSDLIVTMDDGQTVLPREVVHFDPLAELAEIWVRVPTFSSSAHGFYLYYGNPDTTVASSPPDAWKPEYRAVYHFSDDPGAGLLSDSSPVGADAVLSPTRNWTSADVTDGPLMQAWEFNGTTHHIATKAISTQDSSYAISGWLRHVERGVDFFMQTNPDFWHLSSQRNGVGPRPDYVSASQGSISWLPNPIPLDGQFHHFAWVFDGVEDTIYFYYDGIRQPTRFQNRESPYTGQPINPDETEPVGILGPMFFNQFDLMDGAGDEVRVHEGQLSAEWIKTEYRNQRHPETFLIFSPEENYVPTSVQEPSFTTAMLSPGQPNPFRGVTRVDFALATTSSVSLNVYDVAGRRVRTLIDGQRGPGRYTVRWDATTAAGGKAAAGVYFVRLRTPRATEAVKVILLE